MLENHKSYILYLSRVLDKVSRKTTFSYLTGFGPSDPVFPYQQQEMRPYISTQNMLLLMGESARSGPEFAIEPTVS